MKNYAQLNEMVSGGGTGTPCEFCGSESLYFAWYVVNGVWEWDCVCKECVAKEAALVLLVLEGLVD